MRLESYTLIESDMRALVASGWKIVKQEGSGWIMRWPLDHWPPNPKGRHETAHAAASATATATARKGQVPKGERVPAYAGNQRGPSVGAQVQMQ